MPTPTRPTRVKAKSPAKSSSKTNVDYSKKQHTLAFSSIPTKMKGANMECQKGSGSLTFFNVHEGNKVIYQYCIKETDVRVSGGKKAIFMIGNPQNTIQIMLKKGNSIFINLQKRYIKIESSVGGIG